MVLLVVREAIKSFLFHRNLEKAATLAYYGALALMPLLLLVVILLGTVMRSSDAVADGMDQLMTNLFPSYNRSLLDDLFRLSGGKTWSVVGGILLFWSLMPFAAAFRNAVSEIFRAQHRLDFVRAKIVDVAAALTMLVVFVLLVVTRVATTEYVPNVSGWLYGIVLLMRMMFVCVLTAILLTFFYRLFATEKIPLRHLMAGALVAAGLLAVFRPLFGLFLRYDPHYGYAFGSLKVIFLLIIWTYYTFAVILFGAEVSAAIRRRNALLLSRLFTDKRDIRQSTRRLLSRFVQVHDEGDVLFREGEHGTVMFYVEAGQVAVRKNDCTLKSFGPGEYLGEMAMLLGSTRTATAVVTAPDTQLIRIAEDNFEVILRENPKIVRGFLREMASRLQHTSDQVR